MIFVSGQATLVTCCMMNSLVVVEHAARRVNTVTFHILFCRFEHRALPVDHNCSSNDHGSFNHYHTVIASVASSKGCANGTLNIHRCRL